MKTTLHKSGNTMIYTIHEDDLFDSSFGLKALKEAENFSVDNAVLNLKNVKVIQSQNIKHLNDIVGLFAITGKKAVVCGFDPVTASGLIHFLDKYDFESYLNVEDAIDAL